MSPKQTACGDAAEDIESSSGAVRAFNSVLQFLSYTSGETLTNECMDGACLFTQMGG